MEYMTFLWSLLSERPKYKDNEGLDFYIIERIPKEIIDVTEFVETQCKFGYMSQHTYNIETFINIIIRSLESKDTSDIFNFKKDHLNIQAAPPGINFAISFTGQSFFFNKKNNDRYIHNEFLISEHIENVILDRNLIKLCSNVLCDTKLLNYGAFGLCCIYIPSYMTLLSITVLYQYPCITYNPEPPVSSVINHLHDVGDQLCLPIIELMLRSAASRGKPLVSLFNGLYTNLSLYDVYVGDSNFKHRLIKNHNFTMKNQDNIYVCDFEYIKPRMLLSTAINSPGYFYTFYIVPNANIQRETDENLYLLMVSDDFRKCPIYRHNVKIILRKLVESIYQFLYNMRLEIQSLFPSILHRFSTMHRLIENKKSIIFKIENEDDIYDIVSLGHWLWIFSSPK